jgi:PAS domain S-box-containing protein
MSTRKLPGRLWLGIALIVVPLAVLIALESYQAAVRTPSLARGRDLILHTFDVLGTARSLERAIQDAERGQRGYLLTGNPDYLKPYRTGESEVPILFARLKALTADNPNQQRRMNDLEVSLDEKLTRLRRTLDVRERDGFDAARKNVMSGTGLVTMQRIGTLIDAIVSEENTLLTERVTRLADEESEVAHSALVGGGIALGTIIAGVIAALLAFRQLQRAEGEHRASEERFRLLVDGTVDHAIFTLDPHGFITDWNAGAQRIKGYRADEIVGEHFSRFYTAEDRRNGVPQRALETALREGKFEAQGWRVRKDGNRFWAHVTINPLYDASGRLFGYGKVTRDNTVQREQQLALDQAKAALAQSQKMEALGQLSGGIAHDFNNLLHVILNCVEILQRSIRNPEPEVTQNLDMVKRNASRAASLTQRMLAFARRQPLEPRPIDPNKLVTGMVDLLRRSLGESVDIETVLGAGTWVVSADANQLEAAILNLAVNGRDAMAGRGKLTIETTNAFLDDDYVAGEENLKAGQYAMIAVSDTGMGMTKEIVEKAFDPFFTTKQDGQGTGLGLSQVHGFVKQTGGHVKIYSEPGQGTTVKLYLPRLPMGDVDDTWRGARSIAASTGSETILLVEDDADVRVFTTQVLHELGYRVLAVADARAAVRVLESESDIRLLFTDVGLPNGLNGRELADEVKRRSSAIKVLFTTGYARNAIVHHGRLDPGVELIVKPFTQSALARKVRQVLDGAH